MSEYPEPAQRLHDTLDSLAGVFEVELDIQSLESIADDDLSLPGIFADLPHVALRRTQGGLTDEVLVTARLQFEANREGWVAVEFLAWWVRDLSRSGTQVQMRPLALPPVGYGIQLGRTLSFVIEFFYINPGEDAAPLLKQLGEHAVTLSEFIEIYAEALANPVEPGSEPDEVDVDVLHQAAENGHAEAQFELAQHLRIGEEVDQDHGQAFRWYSESAGQGYPPAIMMVGYCHAQGLGVAEDAVKAIEHYRVAAEAGLLLAMGLLGQAYEDGKGVKQNASEAVKWYQLAADAGEASCQAQLGECFEQGKGVQQDLQLALKWYQQALEQGLDSVQEAIDRVEGRLS